MADAPTDVSELVVAAPKKRGRTRTYRPQISVVLRKNVSRGTIDGQASVSERYKEGERVVDLTPYLGVGAAVTVSRSVRDPSGMFSLTMGDQINAEQEESFYGLIEPMDLIEIRMARDISTTDSSLEKRMPLMMRGFVGDVRREMTMTDSGPQRRVIVSGHDYGKILQIIRIIYLNGMTPSEALLSSMRFATTYGTSAKGYKNIKEFFEDVTENVINDFLTDMIEASAPASESPVVKIELDCQVTEGNVSPIGIQSWQSGSILDMLNHFGDVGPWTELYIEDREEGPFLVYRPTPFKTPDGEYVQDGGSAESVDVWDSDIVSLSISRSDESVANYYWVDAPALMLNQGGLLQAMANNAQLEPKPFLEDHQNSSPKTYGVRPMMTTSQWVTRTDGKPEEELKAGQVLNIEAFNEKRRILQDNNKDNVIFESGSMRIKGNEDVRHGMYVNLVRGGGFTSEAYAYRVLHEFVVGGTYTTSIEFDRGTGYIERIKRGRGADSAYYAEMSLGGAYGR